MYQFIASASLAAFAALSAGLHVQTSQSPSSGPSPHSSSSPSPSSSSSANPSPSPSVSAVANGPILSQLASGRWTTTVVLQASDVCVSKLTYELVTTQPVMQAHGEVTSHVPIPPSSAIPVPCPSSTTTEAEEVTLAFTLPSVPLAATLIVVDDHDAHPAPPAAIAMMAIHRYVSSWDYLWWPIISGALLALIFANVFAIATDEGGAPHPDQEKKPRKPIYASATWTFKDSWATNIGVGATAIAAILTGAGAVSTQFPGVQLDRYAVLMAACGLLIVSAPLVFGILYAWPSRSPGNVPDNAELLHYGPSLAIEVPGGASLTFPSLAPNAKDPLPVTPGKIRIGQNITPVISSDGTIVLKSTDHNLAVRAVNTVPGPDSPPPAASSVEIMSPGNPIPPGSFPFVTVKATGFARIKLPRQTIAHAPDGKETEFRRATMLRVPLGSNVIVADFQSLIPAALVTMFGIGAELGILGVLAFALSNRTAPVRGTALALVIVTAIIVLCYAIATTLALADSTPGSALSPDSSTSATL
jgi:hypothetical protein